MWVTPREVRALTGKVAEVFREGLADVVEELQFVELDEVFDRFTENEKVVALAAVAKALLDPEEPAPRHTAWAEATIFSVFLMLEARAYDFKHMRQMIRDALVEAGLWRGRLRVSDVNVAVEILATLVLCDRNWRLAEVLASDAGDPYFVGPPVPTVERIEQAWEYLRSIGIEPF